MQIQNVWNLKFLDEGFTMNICPPPAPQTPAEPGNPGDRLKPRCAEWLDKEPWRSPRSRAAPQAEHRLCGASPRPLPQGRLPSFYRL